jgi:hypothetical protein
MQTHAGHFRRPPRLILFQEPRLVIDFLSFWRMASFRNFAVDRVSSLVSCHFGGWLRFVISSKRCLQRFTQPNDRHCRHTRHDLTLDSFRTISRGVSDSERAPRPILVHVVPVPTSNRVDRQPAGCTPTRFDGTNGLPLHLIPSTFSTSRSYDFRFHSKHESAQSAHFAKPEHNHS